MCVFISHGAVSVCACVCVMGDWKVQGQKTEANTPGWTE